MENIAQTNTLSNCQVDDKSDTSFDFEYDDQSDTSSDCESDDQSDRCEYSQLALELASKSNSTPQSKWRSKRFIVGVLLFIGYFVNSMAYQVFNFILVDIALDERRLQYPQCALMISGKNHSSLNMYWYGFMFSAIGGCLAQKFGGPVVLGVSTLLSGIFTAATLPSMEHKLEYYLACRCLVGLFQGFSSASYCAVFANWAVKEERYIFMFYTMNGTDIANVILGLFLFFYWHLGGLPVEMVFYGIGVISVAWAVLWLTLVRNTPSDDPWISKPELDYILERTENSVPKQSDLSFEKILKSPLFWALSIGQFAVSWGSAFIQIYVPIFKRDVLKKCAKLAIFLDFENIIFTPIIFELLMLKDKLLVDRILPKTELVKKRIMDAFFWIAILFGMMVIFYDFSYLLQLSSTLTFQWIRFVVQRNKIQLDMMTVNMAPNHAALMSGLTSFWQAIGMITMQTIVGLLAGGECWYRWLRCLIFTTAVFLVSGTVFHQLRSNDPQPWSVSRSSEKDDSK